MTGILFRLVTVFVITVIAFGPSTVLGNGRVVSFESKVTGPYEIAFGTIPGTPSVGNLHITISLTEIASDTLITGATVTVSGMPPPESGSEKIDPIHATTNLQDPTFYDVNTVVDQEGIWTFTTTVQSIGKQYTADFEVTVKNASPIAGLVTLMTLIAFLVVLGLAIRASLGRHGTARKK